MYKFNAWLKDELNKRSWSLRELSRQADIGQGHLSRILKGQSNLTADMAIKISLIMNTDPVAILKLAGLIPQDVNSDNEPELFEINLIYRNLDTEGKKLALDYIRFLKSRQG